MEPSELTQKELRELRAMGLGLRCRRAAVVDYTEDVEEEVIGEEKKVRGGVKRRRPSSGERRPRRKGASSPARKKSKFDKPERHEQEVAVTKASETTANTEIVTAAAAATVVAEATTAPTAFVKVAQLPEEEIKAAVAAATTKYEAKLYKLFKKIHNCRDEHKILEVLFVVAMCGKFEMPEKGAVEFSLGDMCRSCIKRIKKIMKY